MRFPLTCQQILESKRAEEEDFDSDFSYDLASDDESHCKKVRDRTMSLGDISLDNAWDKDCSSDSDTVSDVSPTRRTDTLKMARLTTIKEVREEGIIRISQSQMA